MKDSPVYYIMSRLIVVAFAVSGLLLTEQIMPFLNMTFLQEFAYRNVAEIFMVIFIGGMIGAALGWLLRNKIIKYVGSISGRIESDLKDTPADELVFASIGVVTGLIIANLFAIALWQIPYIGAYLPIFLSLAAAYICGAVGKKKGFDIANAFRKIGVKSNLAEKYLDNRKIVDTSVIIDGRIEEIFKTGFIDGTLIVPHFVIKEMQTLADSADDNKRAKGRMALDTLNRLRNDYGNMIRVDSTDYQDMHEVDLKLLRLAQETNAKILTVDYNLNKVAMLHGIFVLNVNELANAIKSNIVNGETLRVKPVKPGKENGQSVCYLNDGTMIIIEDGRDYIGQEITVVVHSVFQTPAGRLVFSKTKDQVD